MTNQNKDNFTKSNSVHSDVKGDLFTSKLMRGTPISEEIFDNPSTTDVPVTKPAHSHLLRNILYGVTAGVIALLAFATFWFYRAAHPTSKTASDYGATTADIAALTSTKASTANGFVIINGNANVNGSVTADNFAGNGADLNNVNATRLNSQPGSFYQNADNIDAGTLSDARLSGNVALLDASQSFTGTNSFANTTTFVNLLVSGTTTTSGAVTINNTLTTSGNSNVGGDLTVTGTTNINGLSYSWPGAQGSGILANDGTGNLAWQAVGACASCLTNGGNAFGTTISVGTNDANALYLRTNSTNQVTLDTAGNLGIGTNPGYKLDVNGDVNVSTGNAFRIGGTAICTSGGCAASAGSTDYVQNSASLQTGVNFNFEIASINSVGGIIRAKAGQVADLQQWQDSTGTALTYVAANGNLNVPQRFDNNLVITFGGNSNVGFGYNAINAVLSINTPAIQGGTGSVVISDNRLYLNSGLSSYIEGTSSTLTTFHGALYADTSLQINSSGSLGTVEKFRVGTPTTLDNAADVIFGASSAAAKGLVVQAAAGAGSVVSVLEVQNSSGTKIFGVNVNGTNTQIGSGGSQDFYFYPRGAISLGITSSYVKFYQYLEPNSALDIGRAGAVFGTAYLNGAKIASTGAFGTVEKFRVDTPTTVDNLANVMIGTSATTSKALVIQGVASQSANLQEWQNSTGTILADISAGGRLDLNTGGGGVVLSINNNGRASFQAGNTAWTNAAVVMAKPVGTAYTAIGVMQFSGLQTGNLIELMDTSQNVLSGFNASGNLILGRASGVTGSAILYNSGGAGSITLTAANPAASNYTITFPAETGTVCTTATSGACTSAGGFVQLQASTPGTQQTGNLNISGVAIAGTAVGVGSNAASAGALRLANAAGINFRNAANTADIPALSVDTNNYTTIGSNNGSGIKLQTSTFVGMQVTASVTSAGNGLGIAVAGSSGLSLYNWNGNVALVPGTAAVFSTSLVASQGGAQSIIIYPSSTSQKGLVVQGAASQTANLQEWQNSTGTVLASVSAGGSISGDTISGVNVVASSSLRGPGTVADSGGLRLSNASNISWRNAANTGNKSISISSAAGPTDALILPQNAVLGGSDATAGALYFFNNAVSISRTAASGLSLKTNSVARITINDGTSTGSVGIAVPEYFVGGAVEKLRINTPTTTDALANVIFSASAATSKPLVIQAAASQSANLQEWQDSSGNTLASIGSGGVLSLGRASGATGSAILYNSAGAGNITLTGTNPGASTYNIAFPAENGTVCTTATAGACTTAGGFVQLQASTPGTQQTGNLNISGVAIAGTAVGVGSNAASAGAVRLSNATNISFRNGANTGDINTVRLDASDNLLINGGNGATGVVALQNNGISYLTVGASASSRVNIATGNAFLSDFIRVSSTTGSLGTVEKLRVNAPTTVDNLANVIFSASATTSKPLVIQGLASQTANLTEWQSSTGTSLVSVTSGGDLTFGTGATHTITLATSTTGAGNTLAITGAGGLTAGNNAGGIVNLTGGLGGASTGLGFGGAGGAVNITGGASSNSNWQGNNGGTVTIAGGAGGTSVLANNSTGGALLLNGGSGGNASGFASGGGGTGGAVSISAGNGGNAAGGGTQLGGNGASITLTAGNGGNSTVAANNSNGGSITLIAGSAGTGGGGAAGTVGNITLQGVSGSAINIGTNAAAQTITIGNTTGASDVNVNMGSGVFNVTNTAADANNVAQFNNAGGTTCTVQPGGTGFACSSDERLKTNVLTLNNSSDIVNKLRGVSFNWLSNPTGQIQSGFIAQELMQVIPGAVSQDSNGFYVANYSAIVPYLVNAFQDSDKRLTTVESKLNDLQLSQGVFNGGIVAGDTEFQAKATFDGLASFKGQTVFTGGATFEGVTNVKGRLQLSNNNTGSATVAAGATSVHVTLPSGFSAVPNVNLTPQDFVNGQYRVTHVTTTGFDIETSAAQTTNTAFYWQAF